jgi:hypothetical protein
MHHCIPFHQLSPNPHAKDKHGGAASINFAGISWWHVKQVELGSMDMTQGMKHQVEGQMRGRERLGGATRGARGQESYRGKMIVLEESRGGEEHQATQAGPPPAPIFCRQASLSFLSLCVQVCVPRTSVDIANLPKLDSSKKSTPLIHSKSRLQNNICVPCYRVKTPDIYL